MSNIKMTRSNTLFKTNKNSVFVDTDFTLNEITLKKKPASTLVSGQCPKNVMVYCKKFDDNVINSFIEVF